MIWFEAVPRSEHPLFARIKKDLDLTAGLGAESYDGLLILAWFLQHWPERIHVAVSTLGVSCPRRANKQWQYTHPDIKREVEALLKAAGVTQAVGQKIEASLAQRTADWYATARGRPSNPPDRVRADHLGP